MKMSIRTKLLILFAVLFALLFLVGGFLVEQYAVQVAKNGFRTEMLTAAQAVAKQISPDDMAALIALNVDPSTFDKTKPYWGIDDPTYQKMCNLLAQAKALHGQFQAPDGTLQPRLRLYTYVPTSTQGVVEYIGSSSSGNKPPGGAQLHEHYTTQPFPGEPNRMVVGLSQPIVNVDRPYTDKFGTWYSAFAPIMDANNNPVGAVGIDIYDSTVASTIDTVQKAVLVAFVVAFAILFVIILILSRALTAPLRALTSATALVAEGKYDTKLPKAGRFADETAQLAGAFEVMIGKVQKREETLKQEVAQLRVEIDEAKRTKQVSEIVESEFFRDLQVKAKAMRNRRQGP